MTPGLLKLALLHAQAQAPAESCGLIVAGADRQAQYLPCRNIGSKDRFRIHPSDWMAAEDAGTLLGFVHSHPGGTCEPGPADRDGQAETLKPWWIVTPEGAWSRFGRAKFQGRTFCWGVQDCYTLVSDWFGGLPEFLRTPDFWEQEDLFMQGLQAAGFREIPQAELLPGDGLLFSIRGRGVANHCAVYLGEGQMLHHLPGRTSIKEPVGAWVRTLKSVVRRDL